MRHILSPEEMRLADRRAIVEYSIPSAILMENAAISSAAIIRALFDEINYIEPTLLFLCGSGNNGGDGFAIARHLFEEYDVRIAWLGAESKMSPETFSNYNSCLKLGIELYHIEDENDLVSFDFSADCIIDAMLGVGGSENVKGIAAAILKRIKNIDALKIAIDAPTGLNTDTGIASNDCFRADATITMHSEKRGLLQNDGIEVCGEIFVASIGAPSVVLNGVNSVKALDLEDVAFLLPKRRRISSKFDYGKVMVIAGSEKYPGAAALCANAAIRAGAGLVYLHSTAFHQSLLPEVIPCKLASTDDGSVAISAFDSLLENAINADAIAIGPGLSDNTETTELVKRLLDAIPNDKVVVVDADGLRAITLEKQLRNNVVITPHLGEFSRLSGMPVDDFRFKTTEVARDFASKLNCTLLLKHVPTVITDGDTIYWNTGGNSGMASGGSGDVLTGIIVSLAAQGLNQLDAAAAGAFIHSLAGDLYAEDFSEVTLTAGKLIDYLEQAFLLLNNE
jgi:NAD(P)H-hydrate epimerase